MKFIFCEKKLFNNNLNLVVISTLYMCESRDEIVKVVGFRESDDISGWLKLNGATV